MNRLTAIYVVIAFVLAVGSWALEAAHYNSYLDLGALLRSSLLLTLLCWGVALAFTFRWWRSTDLAAWQQLQRVLVVGMIALLVVPPLFSASNRWGTSAHAVPTSVEFQQESARYQSRFGTVELGKGAAKPSQYLLFFYWDNQLHRIAYESGPKFADLQEGDTFTLAIAAGRWGHAWVPDW